MGARQVLRAAGVVALLVAPGVALAQARPRVGVVDARPPDAARAPRDALSAELAASSRIALVVDAAHAAALLGEPDPTPRAAADALLERASAAYLALRLAEAREAAEQSALAYLSLADPSEVAAPLSRALAVIVVCADLSGDRSAAQGAANRLRALGAGAGGAPPEPIPAATWARYPEIDAGSNVILSPVAITTDPPGASVLVDLRPVGTAPLELALAPGTHWITAAAPGRARTTTVVDVAERREQTAHVALAAAPPDPWSAARQRVAALRAKGSASDAELTALLGDAGVDAIVVLIPGGDARVVGSRGHAGRAPLSSPSAIVAIAERAVLAPVQAPPPEEEPRRKRSPLWVYAAVVGVVLAGAGIVYLLDSGEDVQRIEIRFP